MDAAVKVRVSGKALAEAVAQYLERKMAPGCEVRQVYTVPEPGDDCELAFDVEVVLPDEAPPKSPLALPEFPPSARRRVPRPVPPPPVDDDPSGLDWEEGPEPAQEPEPVTAQAPAVETEGGAVRLREAPTLEGEEIAELDEVDPVRARARRRARAHSRMLGKRGDRRE